ncbi:oligosaccharide flippase family protein [Mucilaginibacter sp. HMF5004]|uniref:lipopolysaccharide biosynthesis protein n=1 Tax=Mucilaginibacter rivuli TaxID=2857527 RepID=UPI001C5D7C07|nr:oligosaccharide flippase family protein [Mucilaginibacter rivuli]MBW4890156.1 oligosaccharide flippase family protein [Mucilaginibacter rivuli]
MKISLLNNKLVDTLIANKANLLAKVKTTGLYLLVPIINFSFSVFTSPIFAKYLTVEEFGYFGYYNTLSGYLLVFYSLSFQTYYMSVYFRESESERKSTLVSLILFTMAWNLLFFPIAYAGLYLYFKYSHSITPFYPYALLLLSGTVLGIAKGFVQVNFRMEQKPVLFLIWVSGFRVASILVSLYFVIGPQMHLMGRLIGILLVEVFFFVVTLYLTCKNQKIRIDMAVMRVALKKIAPLLPASLLFITIFSFDNIALERMNQPKQLGLYNIGKNISQFLYTALYPFFQAFEPDIYKHATLKDHKSLKRIGFLIFGITALALVSFWLVSPYLIQYLTAGKYTAALKYSNVLAISYCLNIFFAYFDAVIMAWQETKVHLYINIVVATLSIIIYTIASKYFSAMGIAVACDINWALLLILQLLFVYSKLKAHRRERERALQAL